MPPQGGKLDESAVILNQFRRQYPDLWDEHLYYRAILTDGCWNMNIPNPFWNVLSAKQKRALADELDAFFGTDLAVTCG